MRSGPLAALFRRNRSLTTGALAQALQYGSALLLLPVMVTRLSSAEIGIWYVFMTAYGLAGILDFGFQPTFARSFALAHSGVGQLGAEGIANAASAGPNTALSATIIAAARTFYGALALLLGLFLLAAGTPYIAFLARRDDLAIGYACGSWIVFAAGIALGTYFQWIPPILIGTDRTERTYQVQLVTRGLFVVSGIAVLCLGGRLVELAIAYTASQVAGRLVASWLLADVLPRTDLGRIDRGDTQRVLAAMWPNARRMGLAVLGGFLITRSNLFAISTFLGLAASASYAVSFQLLYAVFSVGQMPMQIALSRIVAARVAQDQPLLRRLVLTNVAAFLGVFGVGAALVIVLMPIVLTAIGSHVRLLPTSAFALLAVVLMLEGHQWVTSFVITTGNRVPFAGATLAAGAAIALLAPLAAWRGLGITGVLLCQGLVQAAYNNWRWPLMTYREIARPRANNLIKRRAAA